MKRHDSGPCTGNGDKSRSSVAEVTLHHTILRGLPSKYAELSRSSAAAAPKYRFADTVATGKRTCILVGQPPVLAVGELLKCADQRLQHTEGS